MAGGSRDFLGTPEGAKVLARATLSWLNARAAYDANQAAATEDEGRIEIPDALAEDEPATLPGGWTDEEAWDELTGAWLVPGTALGRVRIWVATGDAFEPGDDPGEATEFRGNTQFEWYCETANLVDPEVRMCTNGTVALYFSAHNAGTGPRPPADGFLGTALAWGIWRAAALSNGTAPTFGRDFVVRPLARSGFLDWESPDQVVPFGPWAGDADHPQYTLADADPVQAPDGTWIVFPAGLAISGGEEIIHRYEGSEEDGNAPAADAWSLRVH